MQLMPVGIDSGFVPLEAARTNWAARLKLTPGGGVKLYAVLSVTMSRLLMLFCGPLKTFSGVMASDCTGAGA